MSAGTVGIRSIRMLLSVLVLGVSTLYLVSGPIQLSAQDEGDEAAVDSAVLATEAGDDSDTRIASSADNEIAIRSRMGHYALETVGRDDSITHFEVMPVVVGDGVSLFSDMRFFVDNNGDVGGNAGLGFRFEMENQQVFGMSAWYDADDTVGEFFHQAGVGIELLGDHWDFLANGYFPLGDDEHDFSITRTNSQFSGNQILFDEVRDRGEAMPGVDLGLALRLPGDFAAAHDIRTYAGWYHFQGDTMPDIDGYRLRVSALVTDNISAEVEFTDDDTFGSNVLFGGSILLPGSYRAGSRSSSSSDHLRRFAQRNYNVIVARRTMTTSGIAAVNAATGNPFNVQHVSGSGTAGAAGTAGDPFDTVAEAQAAGADILFVHAGSTLSEAVTLSDDESLLGEGIEHMINADGFGTITVPTATGGTTLPVFQSVTGNAITLASNNRVSGFTIDSPTGHGVFGSAVSGIDLANVTVNSAGSDGIFLQNLTGTATLTDIMSTDATGSSLHIDGTTGNVTVTGSVSNSTGRSLLVENTSDDTTVNLLGTTIQESGSGIRIANVDGDVSLQDVTVSSSTGTGIDIDGGDGNVFFNGVTTVNTANGPAVSVQNMVDDPDIDGTQGQVVFNDAQITVDGQTGIFARSTAGVSTLDGTITATNSGAVADIEDSATDIRLTSISADGGPFALRVVNSTGLISVSGTSDLGSGGTIQNMDTALLLDNAGTVALQRVDFDMNQVVVSDTGSDQVSLDRLRVTNTSGGSAIFDLEDTGTFELVNSIVENNSIDVLDAVFNTSGSYAYALTSNTVTTDNNAYRLTANAGAAGSSLSLQANNSIITLNQPSTTFLDVNWDGPTVIDAIGNAFTAAGDGSTAISLTNTSTTELSTLLVQSSFFTFDGANSIGIDINASGPVTSTTDTNTFDFNGADGIGMQFSLAEASTIGIGNNLLTDDGSGATAVLFNTIADQSAIGFSNNNFQFNTASANVDRGFIISTVETDGTVSLSGGIDNIITGATTPFFVPAGTTSGGFLVNGVLVP